MTIYAGLMSNPFQELPIPRVPVSFDADDQIIYPLVFTVTEPGAWYTAYVIGFFSEEEVYTNWTVDLDSPISVSKSCPVRITDIRREQVTVTRKTALAETFYPDV